MTTKTAAEVRLLDHLAQPLRPKVRVVVVAVAAAAAAVGGEMGAVVGVTER